MSEEENKDLPAEEGHSELDLAIESLLTDLKGQSPPETTDVVEEMPSEISSQEAPLQNEVDPVEEVPNPTSPVIQTTIAATEAKVVKKKRWIWILVGLLVALGGAGFYYWKVLKKATPTFTLAPPDMPSPVGDLVPGPLVMDTQLFASESLVLETEALDSSLDSAAQPSHVSKQNDTKTKQPSTDAHGKPVATTAQIPTHPSTDTHGKPVATTIHLGDQAAHTSIPNHAVGVVAKDSMTLPSIQGKMAEGRVGFHTDVVFYTRKKLHKGLSLGQLESIRVVIQNIFYFTEPRKDQIPEIEQQILQKAGFLLPDGQIFLVSLRNLTMEIPP